MAELPIIYTVRLDLTDEVRDEFERWASEGIFKTCWRPDF